MAVEPIEPVADFAALMVFEPRQGSSIRGRVWLTDPSLMTPAEAAEFLGHIGELRAWIAASEAIAIDTVRRGFEQEEAARRAGQPERLGGATDHALAVAEVAAAQVISEYAAARKVNAAEALGGPLIAVLESLECGEITEADASVIVDQASELEPDDAEFFAEGALRRVWTRTGRKRTSSELRPVLRSLRERLHPETIRRRAARAASDRGVWFRPESDGMCTLSAYLPAQTGLALYAGVDAAARAARESDPGDPRTLPQLRADVLASVLLAKAPVPTPTESAPIRTGSAEAGHVAAGACEGARTPRRPDSGDTGAAGRCGACDGACLPECPETCDRQAATESGRAAVASTVGERPRIDVGKRTRPASPDPVTDVALKAEIVVLIRADSLLGVDDEPAVLEGYGPIDAQTARELAVAAPTWQRLFTDDDGVPLSLGRSAYRPPAGLRRFIAYRDGVCRFPGCGRAARRAEIDHIVEWQDGGTTDAANLQSLCAKHHALKSIGSWEASSILDDNVTVLGPGDIRWTSPLGLEYRTGPLERESEEPRPSRGQRTDGDGPADAGLAGGGLVGGGLVGGGIAGDDSGRVASADAGSLGSPSADRDSVGGQDSAGGGSGELAAESSPEESPPPF